MAKKKSTNHATGQSQSTGVAEGFSTRDPADPARSIGEHGIIGNLSTVALVSRDGAMDFLCWPRFDSPTVFAALLDPERGGVFELAPENRDASLLQMYLPDTAVLLTRWMLGDACAEVFDLMPIPADSEDGTCRVVRRVCVNRGTVRMRLRCAPRLDYARKRPQVTMENGAVLFKADDCITLRLIGPVPFEMGDGEVAATFEMSAGETVDFVLDEAAEPALADGAVDYAVSDTIKRQREWTAKSTYRGRWRHAVTRSAITLKLLTSHRHGSMVAAATFGLPETRGGERNWDYRATWIRDASFAVYGLGRLGYYEEAVAFTRWVADRVQGGQHPPKVMYQVDGNLVADEEMLDHLRGYGGAQPVRIGNGATDQLQLDIYGELMDTIYLNNKYGEAISHKDWLGVCRMVEHVGKVWNKPDSGIWEMRSEPAHHLHSRLMCWVAVDRAIRLGSKRSLAAPFGDWIEIRNAISDDIWANFWNEEKGHFVRTRHGEDLDGAMLMMPLVRFVGATDPAWLGTLDAITEKLTDGLLVLRYTSDDGLDGHEGAFAACAFWHVECLARAGRVAQARENFEKLLHHGNHLMLYAEEFDQKGRLLGNFPQAFTHLALISAAYYLDRKLDHPGETNWPA